MATVRQIAEAERARLNGAPVPLGKFQPLDWDALMSNEDRSTNWIVEDLWPEGRHVHLHAKRKTGKSLVTFWMAANIAIGRDPFTLQPQEPQRTGVWDFEMTESDVRERMEDMGLQITDLLRENLHYYLHQNVPPLDTERGGRELLEAIQDAKETVAFIDTMSRVVQGDENSSETYISFYRNTGQLLKAANIALWRNDHEGHEEGRARGSSAKADDVDIVYQLRQTDSGLQFVRKAARISWVAETMDLLKIEEPSLSFRRAHESWPKGTKEKATELDLLHVPLEAGRHIATRMLKDAGKVPGKTIILNAALKYRKLRGPLL